MNNATSHANGDGRGNSLSPEPCVLIPAVVTAVCGVSNYDRIRNYGDLRDFGFGVGR